MVCIQKMPALSVDDGEVLVEDHFCGAGGSSTGAFQVPGVRVVHAANHSKISVQTHASNYPDVEHSLADIPTMDPARDAPRAHILITTPECKAHSYARGRPKDDPSLFDSKGDDTAERSRATMWEVPRWAEVRGYPIVIVENVPQVVDWCGIPAHTPKATDKCNCGSSYLSWMAEMKKLGYDHKIMWLNSMFFPPTPQSRDRVYHVFWRNELREPVLDYRPVGWCPSCEDISHGVQTFKERAHPVLNGSRPRPCRYGQQYFYSCEGCGDRMNPAITPAASAIDWSVPATKIKDREKPLADGTMARIQRGLELIGRRPQVVPLDYLTRPDDKKTRSVDRPLETLTAQATKGLVVHVGGNLSERAGQTRAHFDDEPLRTITATADRALVVSNMKNNLAKLADEDPMGTITTGNKLAVVVPYRENGSPRVAESDVMPTATTINSLYLLEPLVVPYRKHTRVAGAGTEEMHTITAEGNQHYLLEPERTVVIANYGSPKGPANKQGWARRADEDPVGTLTTRDSHAIVTLRGEGQARPVSAPMTTVATVEQQTIVSIEDAIQESTFRMFEPHEIGAGMVMRYNAWGGLYVVHGTRREQVQQYGNAVTPPVMRWLVAETKEVLS